MTASAGDGGLWCPMKSVCRCRRGFNRRQTEALHGNNSSVKDNERENMGAEVKTWSHNFWNENTFSFICLQIHERGVKQYYRKASCRKELHVRWSLVYYKHVTLNVFPMSGLLNGKKYCNNQYQYFYNTLSQVIKHVKNCMHMLGIYILNVFPQN